MTVAKPATTKNQKRRLAGSKRWSGARWHHRQTTETPNIRSTDRTGMQKIKSYRSADCVVGGLRYGEGKAVVGSLLLDCMHRGRS